VWLVLKKLVQRPPANGLPVSTKKLDIASVHPGALRDLFTGAAGVATGVLSAAFGVGGAVLSTPAIRVLGETAALSVGTTLPSILPSAATGTSRYARERLVDWRAVAVAVPPGVAGSVGGSVVSRHVPGHGHWLMVATAVLVGLAAWRMARTSPALDPDFDMGNEALGAPAGSAAVGSPPVRIGALGATGLAAGLLSGLLGVGGGVILVPAFAELGAMPIKTAIASSLACVGLLALPGTITHAALGDIDWRTAAALTVGVVPGAVLGARAAARAADHRLRVAMAAFLGVVAVVYAAAELAALFQ